MKGVMGIGRGGACVAMGCTYVALGGIGRPRAVPGGVVWCCEVVDGVAGCWVCGGGGMGW